MGIFEVSEANRKAKCLEIKAYDYMVRFEKAFTSLESIGNAYDFMVLCSTACEVTLAQDRATIEAMPNGTENLSIYSDNDIETYRDVLFYVGQVLGGFFVINRAGELELRKYGNTPVLTVERKHRFTSSFSDFITRYTAVSSTNLRTQIAEYYALDPDDPEEEPVVIGSTEEQTITVSLPMSWQEDGHADVIFSFEFNNQMIPVHYPQENWHSGRHTILLYYPIEDVVPNYTNIFNVYMRCVGGTAAVDTGMCIASISGQSMGASAAWDGRIDIEEYVDLFRIGNGSQNGRLQVKAFTEADEWEVKETMRRYYSDVKNGRTAVGAFAMVVDVPGSNA
jgi:hypothetical protein